jgi:ATP-dependent helicase/DNAse subunit B
VIRIEKRILSPTAINTYLSCPRKFYLRYIKKLPTRPSIHLIRGSLIHKTLQTFNKNRLKGSNHDPEGDIREELLTVFNQYWQESLGALNALGLSPQELRNYHQESEIMLTNFSQWFYRQDLPPLVDYAEVKLFSNQLQLMGIIDAIKFKDHEVILIDYKTSSNFKITDDIYRQAALYALLYRDRYNKIPDLVAIHFLKDPGDPIPIHIDEIFLEYGDIINNSIREKTRSTDEKDYPCTCGGYCERDFTTPG